ncbi:hypothetical protein SLEP1_g56152 [Rubroshorea leprosula]|uniref:Uncharacterized protein n=1 Tax=Rubroshorea leprosula TaxID=152421 RepID=A0AAV5MHY6_9ROSI|nr:hypothetical protein SLEP1_g56151 [Rubroshorea leprosula]GKV49400.1 hypothetical protein SLEP1_g56152 [Rubroshorea leprosula]
MFLLLGSSFDFIMLLVLQREKKVEVDGGAAASSSCSPAAVILRPVAEDFSIITWISVLQLYLSNPFRAFLLFFSLN